MAQLPLQGQSLFSIHQSSLSKAKNTNNKAMLHIHCIEHTPCLDKFLYHHLQEKKTERYNELYFPHKLKSTYALNFNKKFSCLTSPIVEMHIIDFNSQVELNSFYLLIFFYCQMNFIHRRA